MQTVDVVETQRDDVQNAELAEKRLHRLVVGAAHDGEEQKDR